MSAGKEREDREKQGAGPRFAVLWTALRQHWLHAGASLALGIFAGLAVSSRFMGFWALSRIPRLVLIVASAILLAGGVAVLIDRARRVWPRSRRWMGAGGLAAAILVGAVLLWTGATRPSLPPAQYRLEIESLAAQGAEKVQVHLLEIRAPSGRALEPEEVQVEGGWERSGMRGFVTDGPARLAAGFYDQPGKRILLLFEEQPQGGQVLVRLDQQEQQIDLTGELGGMRQVALTLPRKLVRWEAAVIAAEFVAWLGVFPLLLVVTGYSVFRQAIGLWPVVAAWGAGLQANYPAWFVAFFIGLLLLPLTGYPGSLAKFEREFFGARQLQLAYSFVRERILGDVYFYHVMRGRDGWLMFSSSESLETYQRTTLFRDEELELLRQELDSIDALLDQAGIEFLIYVAPDKNTIYPEYFPRQVPVLGAQSRLDQVIAYQKQYGRAQILDLRPALKEARREFDPQGRFVYLKTDTHWNAFGALVAYQQVLLALQGRFPVLEPLTLADFSTPRGNRILGDMARNWVPSVSPEEWIELKPLAPGPWRRYNISDQTPVKVISQNPTPGLPKAMIYHDSFMLWQFDLFAEHFSKAQYIWTYQIDVDFVLGEQPDIVILEVTERFLPSLLKNETVNLKEENLGR